MQKQVFLIGTGEQLYRQFEQILRERQIHSLFLVCDEAYQFLPQTSFFETLPDRLGIRVTHFNEFEPNPTYESVIKGIHLFNAAGCEMIAAIGGGSAIDVAKCIKLYCQMDLSQNCLKQKIVPNSVLLTAIPTTAGTGSESTRFAVIYDQGEKQSVTDDSCLPQYVILDPESLLTLPSYQRKATMMDALCHAIESFWSVNADPTSQRLAEKAIRMILENREVYLGNQPQGNEAMQIAANLAGQAIHLTQTTAGHAMSYKLTSLYGIAHGHAVAVCLPAVWKYLKEHTDQCRDARGSGYLTAVLGKLAEAMGCQDSNEAIQKFQTLTDELRLKSPAARREDLQILADSVNPVRLKNFPVLMDQATLYALYEEILFGDDGAESN